MAKLRCPGMDPARFKPEDIKFRKCIKCGAEIEFWKDDVKRPCPRCKKVNFNPDIGNTCLAWCKEAEKCLGNGDIKEWMGKNKKPKEKDTPF